MRARHKWIRWGGVGTALCALSLLSCKEAVMEPLTVAAVEVAGGGVNLRLGQTVQLTPTLKSAKGYVLPKVGISWSSSDAAKAAISPTGQVTAQARGPVTLTASAGGVSGTAAVTVIGVQSISLAPETLSVIVTQTRAMTATTVLDPGVTVTPVWRSLDTTIARVDTAGRVTARTTTGFVRVEVTAEDKKDTAIVRVVPVPVVSVVVTPDTATRTVGQTLQLTATPKDSIGGTLAGRVVTWTSSDTARASVSSAGLVTLKAAGSVTITATIEGKLGIGQIRARIPISQFTISPSATGVVVGGSKQLTAVAFDAQGSVISDIVVGWTSSNIQVAVINGDGLLVSKQTGQVLVTAGTEQGKSATATVFIGENNANKNFAGSTSLRMKDHSGASFAASNLSRSDLYGAVFRYSNLDNAVFDESLLHAVDFTGASISGVSWTGAAVSTSTKWPVNFDPRNRGMWGPNENYSGQNLSSKNFRWFDFSGSVFRDANLSKSNLIQVNFAGADLTNANLSFAELIETNLSGARLDGVIWTEAKYDRNTKWPTGFDPLGRGMYGPKEDYRKRNFSGYNFFNHDFSGADFSEASLVGSNLAITSLIGTIFWRADLQNAVLAGADLRGANLAGANLSGANLDQAKMSGARFDASTTWPTGYNPVSAGAIPLESSTAITSSNQTSCAITQDNRTMCWGVNGYVGALGYNSSNDSTVSVPIYTASTQSFSSVTSGTYGSCARATSGSVYCWGSNWYGEAGVGQGQNAIAPRQISSTATYVSVVRGHTHSCALRASGKIDCWGQGDAGNIGDGTFETKWTPTPVVTDSLFVQISVHGEHTCALTRGGTAMCWGYGGRLFLGNGSTVSQNVPVVVNTAVRFVQVVAASHTCGLSAIGEAYCWGDNRTGQLGDGTSTTRQTPTKVVTSERFTQLFAGREVTCGLSVSKKLFCWGNNEFGTLGDGTKTNRLTPTAVATDLEFWTVGVETDHACAITFDGVAYCWGNNVSGQLGDGTKLSRLLPTRVNTSIAFKRP